MAVVCCCSRVRGAGVVGTMVWVGGFLGEIAFLVLVTFLFFSGVSAGGGFRRLRGFLTLPSKGVRTIEFSLRALGLGTRLVFSLPEVEQTLTVLKVVTGERVVREGTVALLSTTCAGVVEPLMGSRGMNNGTLNTDLFAPEIVDDSGVLWTMKNRSTVLNSKKWDDKPDLTVTLGWDCDLVCFFFNEAPAEDRFED